MWILNEIRTNKRKKQWKIIIFVLVVILIITIYFIKNYSQSSKITYKTSQIEKRDISSTISVDWKVLYKDQYELNFPISWTLNEVYKKEWDKVKKWEIIASLDNRYLKLNLDKAKIALDTANANLNAKLASKWQKSDVNISEKQLESSNANLDANIKEWQANVDNTQKNVDIAKLALTNIESSYDEDIKNANKIIDAKNLDIANAEDSLNSTIQSEQLNIENAKLKAISEINVSIPLFDSDIRYIDTILWISEQNKNLNDSYEMYLWAKDTSSKLFAEDNFKVLYSEYAKYNAISFDNNLTYPEVLSKLDSYIDIWKNISWSLKDTRKVLETSISWYNFSQSDIDQMITNINNYLNILELEIQKLDNSRQAINSAVSNYDSKTLTIKNSIKSYKISLEQAIQSLSKIVNQRDSAIKDAQEKLKLANINYETAKTKLANIKETYSSQISISQANLDNKLSWFEYSELEPYYTAIDNAKKWILEAEARLSDSKLVSPIDWKIWKLPVNKKWSIINQWGNTPFAIVINKDSMYVEAKVEEWDIPNIKLWQDVIITFNSVDNLKLDWKVYYISDKSDTDTNNIVTYKTEISFNHQNDKVKEWYTTQNFFILKKVIGANTLNIEAVTEDNWKYYVTLLDWTKKEIITWISDGDYIEVISWLKEWEKIRY